MFLKVTILGALLVLMQFGGCVNYPKDFQDFSDLAPDKQAETLKQMPIDRQIDFEIYAQGEEPADSRIAHWIAEEGDRIIPDVLRRFKEEKADHKKVCILAIIGDLCVHGRCFKDHPELRQDLEDETAKMPEGYWKDLARQDISYMYDAPVTAEEIKKPATSPANPKSSENRLNQ